MAIYLYEEDVLEIKAGHVSDDFISELLCGLPSRRITKGASEVRKNFNPLSGKLTKLNRLPFKLVLD